MPFNVFILPLLGGYVLITHWNRTKFYAKRSSGYKLLLESSLAAIVLAVISFLLVALISSYLPALYKKVSEFLPPFKYLDVSLLSFFSGCASWPFLNYIHQEKKQLNNALKASHNYLEILLDHAIQKTKHVRICLKSGKIYIGFITENFDPSCDRRSIKIFPTMSGYRDPRDQSMILTTNYGEVLQSLDYGNEEMSEIADEWQMVVVIDEIQSINIFNPDAYELFQQKKIILPSNKT